MRKADAQQVSGPIGISPQRAIQILRNQIVDLTEPSQNHQHAGMNETAVPGIA